MSALPNFDTPRWNPDFGMFEVDADRQTVTIDQAVEMVLDCLSGRNEYAFGEDYEWWKEIVDDATAEADRGRAVLLIAPNAFGSCDVQVRSLAKHAIHREANRLLGERFDADLEARQ